jgi:hypothetical protein
MQTLRPVESDRAGSRWNGRLRLLRADDEDSAEPRPGGRDAGAALDHPAKVPILTREGAAAGKERTGRRTAMSAPQTVAIHLRRLPKVDHEPGLILLRVEASPGKKPPTTMGSITDAALRGRLAYHDLHSANEIAAVRQALSSEAGETTVYESWPVLESCLQFWHEFTGSRIRLMAWTCGSCGKPAIESLAGSVGESLARRCSCGGATRITIPKTA